MHDKNELCDKIKSIYPDIGECGIDVDVNYNESKKAWVVELKHGEQHLSTHLEPEDADACMEGQECVYLGTQVAQLAANVKRKT